MTEASNQGLRRPQARRKLASRSGVWAHFGRFTDDDGKDKARCDRCRLVLGASTRNGTSTLRAHVRICWGEEAAAAAAAAPSSSRGSPSRESGRLIQAKHSGSGDLARMIALHGYDPSFVEDDYFRSFVRGLNPGFELPSRVAIEEMCDGIFDEARDDSFSRLRRAPGRLSFAVGRAKTIEAGEAMYIACHFIDDQWNLQSFVLHALLDDAEHYYVDGAILGVDLVSSDPVADVIHVISQHKDRLSVVAYDTGDKDIHPELNNFITSKHEDRLSVLAYDITDKDIHLRLKNYIELINSPRNQSCTTTTYLDSVLHSIARCLLPVSDFTTGVFEDMERLHLSRQERLQLLSELHLDYERAYDECWCASYFSLEFLRKRGFTELVGTELFLKHLCKVWEQVYRSIQRTSSSTSPTSNLCLLELFKLKEILQSELARFIGDEADIDDEFEHFEDGYAVNVLRKASNILDQAIQDWYLVWSVPLALDPRYKLRYIEFSFKRAFGSEAMKYVTTVTTNINNLYADYIKEYDIDTITGAEHSDSAKELLDNSSADPLEQAWNEHCRSQNVMAAQVNSRYQETQAELDRYLRDRLAPATDDFDLLNWWKVHSSEYPMVARMARDALAMPTCSELSPDKLGQVRSILRGYSKKPYQRYKTFSSSSE